uniref:Uncharacterized protein n=1 Tax=Globodera rostochiensis TaxID=31243 RepID=A0A914HH08_GLORO
MDSKLQKSQCLKAVKRVRRSLSPALLSPDESEDPQQQEVDAIRATVSGGGADIVVAEPSHAFRLYAMGNFGTFVGQRMNFADWHCFLPDSADITKQEQIREGAEQSEQHPIGTDGGGGEGTLRRSKAKESAAEWIGRTTGGGGLLHLSPEEALYLSHDLKVLTLTAQRDDANAVEWSPDEFFGNLCSVHPNFSSIVRRYIVFSTTSLGCPGRYFVRSGFSSLQILGGCVPFQRGQTSIGALQRELANCKKRLLLTNVAGLPEGLQHMRLQHLGLADVQVLSMMGWKVNRSRISDLNGKEVREDD